MTVEFLSGLDPLEVFKVRHQLELAVGAFGDATRRQVPAGLCDEIAKLLYLLELVAWHRADEAQLFRKAARN